MHRSYATGCTWPLDSTRDLTGAVRRAEGLARSLGWKPEDASALSLVVLELGTNCIRHGGGGMCRLEAGQEGADVIVEDHGPGFPDEILHSYNGNTIVDDGGSTGGGLSSVRRLSVQLVLVNMPDGGGRVRAVLQARRPSRMPGNGGHLTPNPRL